MKKILLFSLFFLQFGISYGQFDTLFYFVCPEAAQSHGDRPVVFRFATLNTPATITISQPANPAFPTQVLNLGVNAAQTLDITPWIDISENKPPNTILNYGYRIHSTAPIMAYYEIVTSCNCNPDIFALKGKNALGTNFIIPAQNYLNNASYARSGFDIVATQNNTSITIVPSNNIVGHAAGIPFNIVLNKGETFNAQAVSIAANQHLSGSTVISDKPIAITINDDSASGAPYGGCADIMGDQIIPVPVTGKEYITLKGYLNGPDKVYVVATQNNTQLMVDGVSVGSLNATNMYVHTQPNATAYIQADKPVYVLHNTGFGCELGGALVPPIVCTGSNTVVFVRSTNEFFALNILVPAGGENSFTLNGSPANVGPGLFQPVPGTANTWMFAQIDASAFVGVLQASRMENPNSKFHLGVIHGGSSSGCRYGYFSDFATFKYEIQTNGDLLCSGDTLQLATDSLPGATYNWTGPNGFTSSGASLQLNNVNPNQSGNYVISGYSVGACELLPDTVAINVISTPNAPNILSNSPLCLGDTLFASTSLNGQFTFNWDFDNGTLFQNDSMSVTQLAPGSYPINLTSNLGACISPTTFDTIMVYSSPSVQYNGLSEICGDSIGFAAVFQTDVMDSMQNVSWYNANGNLGSGVNISNITATSGAYSVENYWAVLTTNNGCLATDTFSITYHPFPISLLTVTPQCDGQTALFTSQLSWNSNVPPNANCTYNLQYGDGQIVLAGNGTHPFDSVGFYTASLTVTSVEGCSTVDTTSFTIVSVPVLNPQIEPQCGQLANFSVGLNLGNYTFDQLYWSIPNEGNFAFPIFEHVFANAGNYIATVNIEGTNNCDFSAQLPFTILPSVTLDNLDIPNVITPNGDGINDELTFSNLFLDCTSFDLIILSRWGVVVYEMNNASAPFAGKDIKGENLSPGVYFYKITTNDGKVASGHLTVLP
ncbi:MAG: gliding motility-associated C-terminal domain-containing protein [Flavobacteriia bacterium]|nr:gliding motility-associated C-terminal domain-containing protein [Flavobacteriia bacterium]